MLRLLLSSSLLVSYVSAVAFPAPRVTSIAEVGELINPPHPTLAPDLRKRAQTEVVLVAPDNTCGFISGLAGAGYNCYASSDKCAFFPGTSKTPGFLGCCNTNYCGERVTCIDQRQYSASSCDNGCLKDTFTLKCTASSAPYCNGVTFPNENVRDWFCDSVTVTSWQTAYTTYNGEKDGRTFSQVVVTLSDTASAAATTRVSSASAISGSASSKPSTTVNGGVAPIFSTSSSPAAASSSSGTPVGGIVGGVVGGVGGFALIAGLIFFLMRRNKKNKLNDPNNGLPPPTYTSPQDPNNSAFAAASAGKPGATTQYAPVPTDNRYSYQNQYDPQMQQQPYGQQEPYGAQQPQQQPYGQMAQQQQSYPPMAEVQGSNPQNLAAGGYYPGGQTPSQTYYSPSQSSNPVSPNSQSHDRNSALEVPGSAPHSPAPTYASGGGPPIATAAPAQSIEGRAEMSANMSGPGAFPAGLHEVPGDQRYH